MAKILRGAFYVALASASAAFAFTSENLQNQCGQLEKKIKGITPKTNDSARMLELQDLKLLIGALRSDQLDMRKIPKSYWQGCLDKSVELLKAYAANSSPGLRLRPDYLQLISELYEIQDNLAMALNFMDDAVKVSKDLPAVRIRAVRIWLALEEKKAREMPSKSHGTPGQSKLMKNRLESYLRPVIDNTHGEIEARLAALQIRAEFYEKIGDLETAFRDWQMILSLDPRNIAFLRKMAALESSRGATQKSIVNLNRILEIDPADLAAHKSLVRIYTDQKDFRSAKSQSRLALKYHPKDAELESILRLNGGN
jgi:tetratricopeptide (TPR) repeat protein